MPIGAGNFGRVSVKKLNGPGSDRDLDGVPTTLDIDDDGDLILDNLDASTKKSHASAQASVEGLASGGSFSSPGLTGTPARPSTPTRRV